MTDPFSVSAGVVGVVSLGLTLTQGFLNYYTPWRDYDDEIRGFTTRVDRLLHTLSVLDNFLSSESELQVPDQYRRVVFDNLSSCEEVCRRLEKILTKCKSSGISGPPARKHDWLRFKRMAYPFKKETLTSLSELVSDLRDNLTLALQLLTGAFLSRQQRQIQTVDIRTMKILNVVEQQATSQALLQSPPPAPVITPSMSQTMPQPSTLRDLCDQQQLIDSWFRRRRRYPSSQIEQISQYCTCRQKPQFKSRHMSRASFSTFSLHDENCSLHVAGQQIFGVAGSYTICNKFLGLSLKIMMTYTKGGGAFAISPVIQFQSVVASDSPVFHLLRSGWCEFRDEPDFEGMLIEVKRELLQPFHERRAAPNDRLEDGSTILHALFSSRVWSILLRKATEVSQSENSLKELIKALIDAGVPLNERTDGGSSASDTLIRHLEFDSQQGAKSSFDTSLSVLEMLLDSGGSLNSVVANGYLDLKWRHSSSEAARCILRNNPEGLEFFEIEVAILSRSAASLKRCLLVQNHLRPDDSLLTGFFNILYFSLGWPEGLIILLESPLCHCNYSELEDYFEADDALGLCFERACDEREIESALILLEYIQYIGPYHLLAAARAKNVSILTKLISDLVTCRRELQRLVIEYLPHETLSSLSLPTNALLDTKAFDVYARLEHCIQAEAPYYKRYSVYYFAELDITIFERLYAAGFTDLTQCPGDCILTFMYLDRNVKLGQDPYVFLDAANWLVSKGASLYELSQEGYPAVFCLVDCFGFNLRLWHHEHCIKGQSLRWLMTKQDPETLRFLSRVMTDEVQDDCLCACSSHNCTSLQQLLRGFYRIKFRNESFVTAFAAMLEALQDVATVQFSKVQWRDIVKQIVRYITFEALELTHTCHKIKGGRYLQTPIKFTQMDEEEICEVREEEASLISRLDDLMIEFIQKYDELRLGLHEFVRGYWERRMDDIRLAEDNGEFDPEELRRVRDLGVILN